MCGGEPFPVLPNAIKAGRGPGPYPQDMPDDPDLRCWGAHVPDPAHQDPRMVLHMWRGPTIDDLALAATGDDMSIAAGRGGADGKLV